MVLTQLPRRIVSLVPSTTESLFALGAAGRIVGVTRFCVHPHEARSLPKVGGTKDVDAARVAALEPDLIVGNCEENSREIFAALEGIAPLYAGFPRTVDQAAAELSDLATLIGADASSHLQELSAARAALATQAPERVAYLIWRDPWMTVSGDTFISSMLSVAGLHNVFEHATDRFPALTPAELAQARPDRVLLSSEPFPFKRRHALELAAESGLSPDRFAWVDGEAVSWHGTRMAWGLRQLARWRMQGWPEPPA